ncbi:MAG: hypothetical protein J4N75_08760 [Chloroflexi bacterium]|nr:hypothetical protein [Chloroflexota bacterium]
MPPTQPPGVPDGVRVLEAEVIKLKWNKSSDLHDFGPFVAYGEHNQEIYGGVLGLDDREMSRLVAEGVIT